MTGPRSSKGAESTESLFYGTKNLEAGLKVKGTFSKKFSKEVIGSTGPFESITYFMDTDDGSVGFNKLGNLGYLMDRKLKVKEGELIEIEYNGKDDKNYHNFDVTVL